MPLGYNLLLMADALPRVSTLQRYDETGKARLQIGKTGTQNNTPMATKCPAGLVGVLHRLLPDHRLR